MQVIPNPGKPGRGPAAITTPGKDRHNASLLFCERDVRPRPHTPHQRDVSGTSGPDLTPPIKQQLCYLIMAVFILETS